MAARYVLCTMIDEVAADTRWCGAGLRGRHSLLAEFYNESFGGERSSSSWPGWPRKPTST